MGQSVSGQNWSRDPCRERGCPGPDTLDPIALGALGTVSLGSADCPLRASYESFCPSGPRTVPVAYSPLFFLFLRPFKHINTMPAHRPCTDRQGSGARSHGLSSAGPWSGFADPGLLAPPCPLARIPPEERVSPDGCKAEMFTA